MATSFKNSIALVLPIIMTLCAGASHSQQLLDYGSYSGFDLGKGILGSDYSSPRSSCVSGTTDVMPASMSNFRVSIVFNQDQYNSAFHIDEKAQASFLHIGGGSESFNFGKSDQSSSTAFDVVVEAYSEADGQTLDHIHWDAPYDSFMTSGDPAKIQYVRTTCGDRFIVSVFNERRLFAVLHVSKSANVSMINIAASGGGQIGISLLSASASLGGDANVSSSHAAGQITVDVYSEGLGGLATTAGIVGIAQSDGLQAIAQHLADYLKAYLHDNQPSPQPVKYQLSALPGMNIGDLGGDEIAGDLQQMKDLYSDANTRIENVASLLGVDVRRSLFKQPDADVQLKAQRAKLTSYLDQLAGAHQKCLDAYELNMCDGIVSSLPATPVLASVELPGVSNSLNSLPAPFGAPVFIPIGSLPGAFPANRPASPFSQEPYTGSILMDGTEVSDAVLTQITSTVGAPSILAAAQAVNPNVNTIDAIFSLPSAYVSRLDFSVPVPVPLTFGAPVLATRRLLSQDFGDVTVPRGSTYLSVWHADSSGHACAVTTLNGFLLPDQSCLTAVGKLIQSAAQIVSAAQVNFLAANVPPGAPIFQSGVPFYLAATVTDCFAPPVTLPIAVIVTKLTNVPGSQMTAEVWADLLANGGMMPVYHASETRSLSDWKAVAGARYAAFIAPAPVKPGVNVCSAHVP